MVPDDGIPSNEKTSTELNNGVARTPSPQVGAERDSSAKEHSDTRNEELETGKLSMYAASKSNTPNGFMSPPSKPHINALAESKSPSVLRTRSLSPISKLENLISTSSAAANLEMPQSPAVSKSSAPTEQQNGLVPLDAAANLELAVSRATNILSPNDSTKEVSQAQSETGLTQSPFVTKTLTTDPTENITDLSVAANLQLSPSPATNVSSPKHPTEKMSTPSVAANIELPSSPADNISSPIDSKISALSVAANIALPCSRATSRSSLPDSTNTTAAASVAANVALPPSPFTNVSSPAEPRNTLSAPSAAANLGLPPSPSLNQTSIIEKSPANPINKLSAPSVAANLDLPPSPALSRVSTTHPPDLIPSASAAKNPSSAEHITAPPTPPPPETNLEIQPPPASNANNNNNMTTSPTFQNNQRSATSVAAGMELPPSRDTNRSSSPFDPNAGNPNLPPSSETKNISQLEADKPSQNSALSSAAVLELPPSPAVNKTAEIDTNNGLSASSVAANLELPPSPSINGISSEEHKIETLAFSAAAYLELPPSPAVNNTPSNNGLLAPSVVDDVELPPSPSIKRASPAEHKRETMPLSAAANLELPPSPSVNNIPSMNGLSAPSVAANVELPPSPSIKSAEFEKHVSDILAPSVAAKLEEPPSPVVDKTTASAIAELSTSPANKTVLPSNQNNAVAPTSVAANMELPPSPANSQTTSAQKEDEVSPKQIDPLSGNPKVTKPKSPRTLTRQSSAHIFSDPDMEMEELKDLRMSTTPVPIKAAIPPADFSPEQTEKVEEDKTSDKAEEDLLGNDKVNQKSQSEDVDRKANNRKKESKLKERDNDRDRKEKGKNKEGRDKDKDSKDRDRDRKERRQKERGKDRKHRERRKDGKEDREHNKDQRERDRERRRDRKRKPKRDAQKDSKDVNEKRTTNEEDKFDVNVTNSKSDRKNDKADKSDKPDKREQRKRDTEKHDNKRSKDKTQLEEDRVVDQDNQSVKRKQDIKSQKHEKRTEGKESPTDIQDKRDRGETNKYETSSTVQSSTSGTPGRSRVIKPDVLRKSILARLNTKEWKEQLQYSSSDEESVIEVPKTPPRSLVSATSEQESGVEPELNPSDTVQDKPEQSKTKDSQGAKTKEPKSKAVHKSGNGNNAKEQVVLDKKSNNVTDEKGPSKEERKLAESKYGKKKIEKSQKMTKEKTSITDGQVRKSHSNIKPDDKSKPLPDLHDKDSTPASERLDEQQQTSKTSESKTKKPSEHSDKNTKLSSEKRKSKPSSKQPPEEQSKPSSERPQRSSKSLSERTKEKSKPASDHQTERDIPLSGNHQKETKQSLKRKDGKTEQEVPDKKTELKDHTNPPSVESTDGDGKEPYHSNNLERSSGDLVDKTSTNDTEKASRKMFEALGEGKDRALSKASEPGVKSKKPLNEQEADKKADVPSDIEPLDKDKARAISGISKTSGTISGKPAKEQKVNKVETPSQVKEKPLQVPNDIDRGNAGKTPDSKYKLKAPIEKDRGSKREDSRNLTTEMKAQKSTTKKESKTHGNNTPNSEVSKTPQKQSSGEPQTDQSRNKYIATPNYPQLLTSPSEKPSRRDYVSDSGTQKVTENKAKSSRSKSLTDKERKSKAESNSKNDSFIQKQINAKTQASTKSITNGRISGKGRRKSASDDTVDRGGEKIEFKVSSKDFQSPQSRVDKQTANHSEVQEVRPKSNERSEDDIYKTNKDQTNIPTSAKSEVENSTSGGKGAKSLEAIDPQKPRDSSKSSRKTTRESKKAETPNEEKLITKEGPGMISHQDTGSSTVEKTEENMPLRKEETTANETNTVARKSESRQRKYENIANTDDIEKRSDIDESGSDEGEVITLEILKRRAEQAAKDKSAQPGDVAEVTTEQSRHNSEPERTSTDRATSKGPPRVNSSVVKRPLASARPRRSALASARPRRSAAASGKSRAPSLEDQSLFQYPLTYTPVEENKEENDLAHLTIIVSRSSVNMYKKPEDRRNSVANQNQFSESEEEPEEVFLTRLHGDQSDNDNNNNTLPPESRGLRNLYEDNIQDNEVKSKVRSKSKFPWKDPAPISKHQFEMSDERFLQAKPKKLTNTKSNGPKSKKPIKSILKSNYNPKPWNASEDDDVSSLDEDENVYYILNVPKKKPPFAAKPFLPDDDDDEHDNPIEHDPIFNQAAFSNSANMLNPTPTKSRQSENRGETRQFANSSDEETLKQAKSRKGILKSSAVGEGRQGKHKGNPKPVERRVSRIPVRTKSQAEQIQRNKFYETPEDSDQDYLKLKKSKTSVSFRKNSAARGQRRANTWMGKSKSDARSRQRSKDRNLSMDSSGDNRDVSREARNNSKQKTKSTIRMHSRMSRSSNKFRNKYESNSSEEDDSDNPIRDYRKQRTKSTIRIRSASSTSSPPSRSMTKQEQKKSSSKSDEENPQMKMLMTLLEAAKEHLTLTNKLKDGTVVNDIDDNNNETTEDGVLLSDGEDSEPLDPKSLTLLKRKSVSSMNLKKSANKDTKDAGEMHSGPRHLAQELKHKEDDEEGFASRVTSTKVIHMKSVTPKGSEKQNITPVSFEQPTPPGTSSSTLHVGSSPPFSPMTPENEGESISMEYLKNHIRSVLPNLARNDLNQLTKKLIGMGVEAVQDLEFVQMEDLEKTRLNPIQARKLLTTWKPNTADNRRSIAGSAVELPTDTDHLPAEELIDKNRWLKFNVGGVMLETTRDTIDRLKSPFLALLLDLDSEDVEPPPDGIYRIDRNPEAFQILLDYARYGKLVGNLETLGEEFLVDEIGYYKMDRSVVKCVTDYFDEKRSAPNAGGIEVEKISITEMSLNKDYKHHNSYGITHTTNLACYTSVPGGKGICQTEVQSLFLYETAYLRFPALFRAPCLKCGHIICFADDPLIGTEGWCHKCHLCLRCQDILCEGLSDDGDTRGQQSIQDDLVRKTAKVVFLHDPGKPNDQYDFSSPRNVKLAVVPYQGGREKTPSQVKTLKFKLPKIPDSMDVPQHSVRANTCMYKKI